MRCLSLADLEERLATVALPDCSEDALGGLVRDLHAARRLIDGHLARIATEANRRQRDGSGPEPGDLFRRGGEVSRGEADRQAERGRLGREFPATTDQMHSGGALTENMDTVARLVRHLSVGERTRLAVFDEQIADRAAALPPETFARWLRKLIRSVTDDDQPSTAERQRARSRVNLGRKQNGMWWISGTFDPERGAELDRAIRAAARQLAGGTTPTANTRADALHRLTTGRHPSPHDSQSSTVATAAAGSSAAGAGDEGRSCEPRTTGWAAGPGDDRSAAGGPPLTLGIGYLIDVRTLFDGEHPNSVAQTWSGDDHDPRAVQRLACDADWYGVHLDQLGRPDAVGVTRRSASLHQRLALRSLYRSCPLDGSPFDQCEIHHVNTRFEDGGKTELANLVPVSSAWHHRIHDRGWSLTMASDRSLTLRRPDGQLDRTIPPPEPLTRSGST